MRGPGPRSCMPAGVGESVVEADLPALRHFCEREAALKSERKREALASERGKVAVVGRYRLPCDAPEVAVVGNIGGACGRFHCAGRNGGKTFVPSAGIACIEGHGARAW